MTERIRIRDEKIMAFLRERGGEAPAKDICVHLGYSWPAQLETARGILKATERRGLIFKSIRPNQETRVAYYSLSRPERQA